MGVLVVIVEFEAFEGGDLDGFGGIVFGGGLGGYLGGWDSGESVAWRGRRRFGEIGRNREGQRGRAMKSSDIGRIGERLGRGRGLERRW